MRGLVLGGNPMTGLLRDAFGASLVLLGFSVMTDRATVLLADKLGGGVR